MIKEAIAVLVSGRSLTADEASLVMEDIMTGQATPAQLGAFAAALRLKGETVDEVTGLARTMRNKAVRVELGGLVVDNCGTGGDGSSTFNISTAAAFVAAGAGVRVAKHGNRAMSSRCGSADVLEALGAKLELSPEQVKRCVEEVGIGFMYAPLFHPAMKHASAPRREIGIRTVFNLLGPLTNPAGAQYQVVGVAEEPLAGLMAGALKALGCRHALVVHGEDGLDEVTLGGRTGIIEVTDKEIRHYSVTPEDFGLKRASLSSLKGGTPDENAGVLRNILAGDRGTPRDVVLLNTAAVLLAAERVRSFEEGLSIARESIDSGNARKKMERFVRLSQALAGGEACS